ncbi:host-nuclease inhibitor Gam family protein, partial [Escherichia sp. SS-MK2]
MNAYYIQDRLEAQSWARHYQQIAREEKEAELADDMEKGLPVSWAAEHIETSAHIQAVDGRRLS